MRASLLSALFLVVPVHAAAEVIDFTTDVTTSASVIDRLPGATVSRGVSGLYDDGLAQHDGGAYNFYGANDLYITFDAPTGVGSIDVWVLPSSLAWLPTVTALTFEMTDAAGVVVAEVSHTPSGSLETVTLGGTNVTTLTIRHEGGVDFYGDGYLSAWYWIDDLVLTTCGDGQVDEDCDDGNDVDGDGCASDCTTEEGWICTGTPSVCTDIDECADGLGDCPEHASCQNTEGSYDCICDEGYAPDADLCVDVDECADGLAACDENATCINLDGVYDCECNEGFDGDGFECEPVEDDDTGDGGGDGGGTGSDDDAGGSDGDDSEDMGDDPDGGSSDEDEKDGGGGCAVVSPTTALGWLTLGVLVPLACRRRRRIR